MHSGTKYLRAPTSGTVAARCESPCSAPMPVMPSCGPLRRALLSLAVLGAALPAFAQTAATAAPATQTVVRDIPRAASEIVVDGVLDDAAWTTATPIDLAFEVTPNDNTPAPVKTTARMAYTDDALLHLLPRRGSRSVEAARVPARPRRVVQRRLRRRDARHLRRPAPRLRILRQSPRRAGRPDQRRVDQQRRRQLGRPVDQRREGDRTRVRRRDAHSVRDAALPRHRRHAPLGR